MECDSCNSCPKNDFDVDVNKLNDQFVHFRIPKSIGNMYDDLCCVPPQHSFGFRSKFWNVFQR